MSLTQIVVVAVVVILAWLWLKMKKKKSGPSDMSSMPPGSGMTGGQM